MTRWTQFAACVWILPLVLATSCSKKEPAQEGTTAEKAAPAGEAAAPVIDAATAATVSGRVTFSGSAPAMQPIDVSSEETCHAKAETHPVLTENVVVNPNGTLRYVFVYVKEGLGDMKFPSPTTPIVLDQVGCRYEPHVFGIQPAQPLTIRNSDEGVLHNIHTLSAKGNSFNFGMPRPMDVSKEFKSSEVMVRIKCDVHSWMHAFAGVVDHPFYGVTGEDGTFKFPPLPPGQYVIEAWHEEYGTRTQTVTVAPQETKEITFAFAPQS
jgi:hypothetical protein